jgi:hypothetical protein
MAEGASMAAYTVFPFNASGVAPVFVSIEKDNDAAAVEEALEVLKDHSSATRVMVWRDDKVIFHGPSSRCILWLAGGKHREVGCPALTATGGVCPPACRL